MSAKTLLSVRISTPLANRLQHEAESLGVPLSAYVRQRLADDLRDRDLLAAVQVAVSTAIQAHDNSMADTLTALLDRYTSTPKAEEVTDAW